MTRRFVSLLALAACVGGAVGGQIPVPNGSFESPGTEYASPLMDSWQKTPKPEGWDETKYGSWDQLVGSFLNVPPPIVNCDGTQAAFLFAVPGAGIFQDYNSDPTHAFDATFETGKSYHLAVGVIGGGGNMPSGAILQLSLYYLDGANNPVPVASTSVTNRIDLFPNLVTFVDFQVNVPTVGANDAWAGKKMGVQLLSTLNPGQGGYWDIDNVRLTASQLTLANPVYSNGQFRVTLQSTPGLRVEMLAADDPGLPILQWSSLGTITNATGSGVFTNSVGSLGRRFYRARALP